MPNVGAALRQLGYQVHLVALVGEDWLGKLCVQLLQPLGNQPGIRSAPEQITSYSIVLAPAEPDRSFIHCAGADAVFVSADVRDEDMTDAIWLHFGYPPVMPAISANGGRELANLFLRAKCRGLRTSLDLCSIDESAAKVDWETVLSNCAKSVTLFAPSIEELRVALRRPSRPTGDIGDVQTLARHLLGMGFALVAIKLE